MTGPSRRAVLVGGVGLLSCGPRSPSPPPLTGTVLGRDEITRAHRVREAPSAPPTGTSAEPVDVAIIGAGVAGLSAAWRLHRAGFTGSVALLELADAPGGTSRAGTGGFPWGAHYITLPNAGCRHVRVLLEDLGVITGWSGDQPRYRATALCFAPQERLYAAGRWTEGLWPGGLATEEDRRQARAFEAMVAAWTTRLGADGRPAFEIPVHRSSRDPEIRRLATLSFADWLDAQGLDAPLLRWTLRYATRDDFGTELSDTSAWAGLHYHCARRPDAAGRDLGTHVLTWPSGNGWLVEQLVQRVPWPVTTGALVRAIVPEDDRVRLHVSHGGGVRELVARTVVAAVPTRVVARLLPDLPGLIPELAPWRVAALHVDRPPASRGVPLAWDSVLLEGRGLGYVSSAHQRGTYGGPSVLTYYDPLSVGQAADGRRALLDASWAEEADRVLSDLAPGHPDLRERVSRLDLRPQGHGTARPVVGLHVDDALLDTSRPHARVWLAHTDRSGMSLFEEASWHGVRAAEQVLALLGRPVEEAWA